MPSSYTQNGGITKPANGELPNTWGDVANLDYDIIDRLTNGVGSIALSATTYTLTTANGSLSEGQFKVLVFTGTLASACTVTISPNTAQKYFFVRNNTNQSVILTQGSGATVTIAATQSKIIYSDGGGATAAVFDFTSALSTPSAILSSPTITGGTMNSTVIGGTTPAAGTFTTVTGNTSVTSPLLTGSTSVTTPSLISGSTLALTATGANPVTITTNGSERARVDSAGNLGLGVTPSAWGTSTRGLDVGSWASLSAVGGSTFLGFNAYATSSSAYAYKNTAVSFAYSQNTGGHQWLIAPSGTAGNAITFTQAMTLDASGNLGVGITPTQRLHVSGNAIITGSFTGGGQIIGPADTAGSPAHTWTGDLTTGLFRAAAGVVAVTTGGTERVRWDSTLQTLASGIGVNSTAANDGTKSSGTYTPTPAGGNFKTITNGGAFTLAAPTASGDYTLIILVNNGASSGAITLSGFTKNTGTSFTTTSTDKFMVFITKVGGQTMSNVVGLQ